MERDDVFSITLPANLLSWLEYKAMIMGLPSRENYVLLLVRQAWQEDHLKSHVVTKATPCIDK